MLRLPCRPLLAVLCSGLACGASACPPLSILGIADFNNDGVINCQDFADYWMHFDAGDLCADVDDGSGTGTVDGGTTIDDLLYWLGVFETHVINPACNATVCQVLDRTGDGTVTCDDVRFFYFAFSTHSPCADLDDGSMTGTCDGAWTNADIQYYLSVLLNASNSAANICGRSVPGDDCASPVNIGSGLSGTIPYDNCIATDSPQGQSVPATGLGGVSSAVHQDLFYCWTAPCSGTMTVNAISSLYNSKIAAYDGCGCPGTLLAGNDDHPINGAPHSTITFPVIGGNSYTIQVGASPYSSFLNPIQSPAGPGTLTYQFTPGAIANNSCAGAAPLAFPVPGGTTLANYDTTCATLDGPSHAQCFTPSGPVFRDLWYRFIASVPFPGAQVKIRACSSQVDRIAVYSGTACGAALVNSIQGCSDIALATSCGAAPSITLFVTPGQTYLIRVGNNSTTFGPGLLALERPAFQAPCQTPSGAMSRVYVIRGCGTGQQWSWSIQMPQSALTQPLVNPGAGPPPFAGFPCPPGRSSANTVRNRFVQSINQSVTAAACTGKVSAFAINANPGGCIPGLNCSMFVIGANSPFQLRVGPPFNPSCLVASLSATVGAPCVFNPETSEIPLEEFDSNGNGIPDLTDIANGLLTDANSDGIADEITQPYCVTDLDNGSGLGEPDGGVGIEDLLYYLRIFDEGQPSADLDDGSGFGVPDGGLGIEDLLFFLARFDAGC